MLVNIKSKEAAAECAPLEVHFVHRDETSSVNISPQ
jgi:hypothetical protein